jgi:single-strand DNA-binding protein
MSVNKVILVGRLGRDPEARYTANQQPICSFAVATSRRYKDKEGNNQEQTEWHNISMFGKLAEIGNQYLKKGSQVYLEGRLQTNKSEKDGQTRYFTQIVADQMTMLGSKEGGGSSNDAEMNQAAPASSSQPTSAPAASSFDEFEDDIPF